LIGDIRNKKVIVIILSTKEELEKLILGSKFVDIAAIDCFLFMSIERLFTIMNLEEKE
jgi:hypothetical protein